MSEVEDNSVGTGNMPVLQREAIPPSAGLAHQSMSEAGPARRGVSDAVIGLDSRHTLWGLQHSGSRGAVKFKLLRGEGSPNQRHAM